MESNKTIESINNNNQEDVNEAVNELLSSKKYDIDYYFDTDPGDKSLSHEIDKRQNNEEGYDKFVTLDYIKAHYSPEVNFKALDAVLSHFLFGSSKYNKEEFKSILFRAFEYEIKDKKIHINEKDAVKLFNEKMGTSFDEFFV